MTHQQQPQQAHDAEIFWSIPASTLTRAGDAAELVEQVERATRVAWADARRLEGADHPTDVLLKVLLRRFGQLLDGSESRFARALRRQKLPWVVADPPLAGVLEQCRTVMESLARIKEIRLLRDTTGARYSRLEQEWASRYPALWNRTMVSRGVTSARILASVSLDELQRMSVVVATAVTRFASWDSEVKGWLEAAGMTLEDGASELRYEFFLKLLAVDRHQVFVHTGSVLRSAMREQVEAVSRDVLVGHEPLELLLALQYAAQSAESPFSADEMATIRATLVGACRRQSGAS